jgi:hypothetical protein
LGVRPPAITDTDPPEGELFQLPIRLDIALPQATAAVALAGSHEALARLGRQGECHDQARRA